MLSAILDPNRAVAPKYVGFVARTSDGLQHTGIIAEETASSITLIDARASRKTLLRNQIVSLESANTSMMPEGFEKLMSLQNMADLISYIQQLD